MAKKALIQKQQRTPKFKVRGVHALPSVRSRSLRVPQVRAVPHLLPGDGACRGDPRHHEGFVVRGGAAAVTMTDPIADMITRIRNANVAFHDDVIMPSSKVKEALAGILVREGYIEDFAVENDPERPGASSGS